MMRVALFGGTFNPPHKGHVRALEAFLRAVSPDLAFVIPAGVPPHKKVDYLPDPPVRAALCRAAFEPVSPGLVRIFEAEMTSPGVSYTADTVAYFVKEYPGAELFFLTGTDMFTSFDTWNRAPFLFEHLTICCMPRDEETKTILTKKERYESEFHAKILLLPGKPYIISSSQVRGELARFGSSPDLPPEVSEIITLNGLYGTGGDAVRNGILGLIKRSLPPERLTHTLSVERECVRLCRYLGRTDLLPDLSYAAFLHDLFRYTPAQEQCAYLNQAGVRAPEDLLDPPVLLHGFTASVFAKNSFGLPENVLRAIRYHTTGHENMSAEDRILYLADGIEETRKQPFLQEARRDFWNTAEKEEPLLHLRRACLSFLESSAAHEKEKGKTVHRDTFSAIESIKKESD